MKKKSRFGDNSQNDFKLKNYQQNFIDRMKFENIYFRVFCQDNTNQVECFKVGQELYKPKRMPTLNMLIKYVELGVLKTHNYKTEKGIFWYFSIS
jgi:hypothetical protein